MRGIRKTRRIGGRIVTALVLALGSGSGAARAAERACPNGGRPVIAKDGSVICAGNAAGAGQNPGGSGKGGSNPQTQGKNLKCDFGTNASGDPLKGLNVSKGGGKKGNVECEEQ